tara:strand:+ start:129 stop:368 length:240 start_codon:yes stop_codon:yes gene_type:complete
MDNFLDLDKIKEQSESDSYAENLNKIRELSCDVRVLELLDPSSGLVNVLAEIIERCKRIPELEMVERNFMNIDNFEAEA